MVVMMVTIDRQAIFKNLANQIRKQKQKHKEHHCIHCGKVITFRYFASSILDDNKRPVKSWRCAFDNTTTNFKHECSSKQAEAQAPQQKEVAV